MKAKTFLLFIALVCFGTTAATLTGAQDQGPSAGGAQGSAAMGQGSSLDTQGIKKYLIGTGDTLDVRVFGQPDLNSSVDVDSDGNVSSLPFIETPIPAKCRTDKEIAKDITAAYGKFLKKPQVSVRVTGRNSRQPAIVFGAVRAPTRVQMQREVRLHELVAVSGGVTERANGVIQVLHTEKLMCPEPGEEVEDVALSDDLSLALKTYKISELISGKKEGNPVIRPGDIVIVTEAEPVYITGSVISPQPLYLRSGMTISRALAMVGGVTKTGRADDIRIYRQKSPGSTEQEEIKVDLNAVKKKQKEDIVLQAYDIIEVPEAGMFSKGRLIQTLASSVLGGFSSFASAPINAVQYKVIY